MSPEEVAGKLSSLMRLNGEARPYIEEIVAEDPRFFWDKGGALRTADPISLPLGEAPYVVFDVETTGSSAKEGAITEIGALKVVRRQVVDQFSTLVNPGRTIEPFVVRLTGITDRMVADAPEVGEVLPLFEEFVEGYILVGHNIQYDCAFVAAARGGVPLPNPVLDTLKLARKLVPGLKRYRLSSLVSHFGVCAAPTHRALADATATSGVFLKLLQLLSTAGVKSVGEAATLTSRSSKKKIEPQKGYLAAHLPKKPGIYYFVDKEGTVLYVGKAKDLKSRVKAYFNGGDRRRKIGRLVREVAEVRHVETESELQALIFEAREIKRLLPCYNSTGRGDKASWYIKLDTREPYPVPKRAPDNHPVTGTIYLGPYKSAKGLDACIEALGRIFPLRRCLGNSKKDSPCFYGQMGRCAPCLGMGEKEYRAEVIEGLVALLRGQGGEEHLKALIRERDRLAGELEFEAATRLRDLVSGIERIRLTRAVATAEGVSALVASSTEPGLVEVFAFARGRLMTHESFEPSDARGLSNFAEHVLYGRDGPSAFLPSGGKGMDETRVVISYLRRQGQGAEAVRLRSPSDLVEAARRVAGAGVSGEEVSEAW